MNYYNEIKNILINNEVYKKVKDYSKNKNDLESYYKVGKLLVEAQGGEKRAKYGDSIIKNYSLNLQKEVDKKYSPRYLRYIRKFYIFQKGKPLVSELSWSHYFVLMNLKSENEINYYVQQILIRKLSKRSLQDIIKNNEYERIPEETKNKLINNTSLEIQDLVKNPIIIKNSNNIDIISEKVLKQLILEDISSFLKELGDGFSYVDNEYKIKIGNTYNYIDLLLFNYKYNSFVVVELKVTNLKKEHVGQIEIYMNYIDKNIKSIYHDKTIGLIVCRKDNKYIIEYSSDSRIFSSSYEIMC